MVTWFGLLGDIEVRIGDQPVKVGHARQKCLLGALLVDVNRPVSVDRLVDWVWGDRPPQRARGTLYSYVSRLRTALATADDADIVRQGGGYLLAADAAAVDLHRFRELVGQARALDEDARAVTLLEQALGLWRGEAFGTVESPGPSTLRAVLDQERLAAELDRNDLALRLGRHQELLADLTTRAEQYPLDERQAEQLMLALYRCGRPADALHHYQRIRVRLAEELGVDPSAPLRGLHQRMLTADPGLTFASDVSRVAPPAPRRRPPAHRLMDWKQGALGTGEGQFAIRDAARVPVIALQTLPRDVPGFTGRHAEVEQLVAAVEMADGIALHTIDGMAGVGKTALAVHAARQLISRFPDGQLFVCLHAHTPGQEPVEPADALAALLISTGIDPRRIPNDLDTRAGLWRDRLAGKRIALVLDDAAGYTQVEPLLPGAEGCLVLVTSRRRIAALDGAMPLPLGTLPPEDAARLFTRLARRTPVTPTDVDAVASIVRLCGYLPLAVTLLAGRFAHHPHWDLADFAAEFAGTRDRLGELDAGDRAVAAAFETSYRALPPERQRLFRLLGLHPGPETDACATAALADVPLVEARKHLEALYDDHLVDAPSVGRYRLHDLVRTFAQALTIEIDPRHDRDAATGRLLNYYQHVADTAGSLLSDIPGPPAPESLRVPAALPLLSTRQHALNWFRSEHINLAACIRQAAAAGKDPCAIRLTLPLAVFLRQYGPWDEAVALLTTALTAAGRTKDATAQAAISLALGRQLHLLGEHSSAAQLLHQAADLWHTSTPYGEAAAVWALGQVYFASGEYQAATAMTHQALDLYKVLGDVRGEAGSLWALARRQDMAGEFPAAATLAERALQLYRSLGDVRGEASSLWLLARIHNVTGSYAQSTALARRALVIYRDLDDPIGEADALWELGRVHCTTGDLPEALDLAQRALDLYTTLGDRLGEASTLWLQSRTHHLAGAHATTIELAQKAYHLYGSLKNQHGQANALQELGRAHTAVGSHQIAERLLRRSRTLFHHVGDAQGEAEALNSLGALLAASARPQHALKTYQHALDLARRVHSPLEEADALKGIALCHSHMGHHKTAVVQLHQATAIYHRIGFPRPSSTPRPAG